MMKNVIPERICKQTIGPERRLYAREQTSLGCTRLKRCFVNASG